MIRALFIAALLSACSSEPVYNDAGKAIYHPTSVDAQYLDDYKSLEQEVNELAHYELLKISETGTGAIHCDMQAVAERQWWERFTHKEVRILGFAYVKDVYVGDHEHVNNQMRKLVLAHEIGHAMGLAHTNTGLMKPELDLILMGSEAYALLQALNEQGIAAR